MAKCEMGLQRYARSIAESFVCHVPEFSLNFKNRSKKVLKKVHRVNGIARRKQIPKTSRKLNGQDSFNAQMGEVEEEIKVRTTVTLRYLALKTTWIKELPSKLGNFSDNGGNRGLLMHLITSSLFLLQFIFYFAQLSKLFLMTPQLS